MAFTTHGHHIPGTDWNDPPSAGSQLCGGPRECKDCKKDVEIFVGEPKNWIEEARLLLRTHLERSVYFRTDEPYEVYIVWSVKVLQNWKGLLATDRPDGMYYELTYDGDKKCWYIDDYQKMYNTKYNAR